MNNRRRDFNVITAGILSVGLVVAASIPAWLDDAITNWNQQNPEIQIQFVDIKDSFVWYMMPRTAELGHGEIRSRIYAMVEAHGYKKTADEELVTTGRPPSPTKPYQAKKCWSRSFTLDIDAGRQRLLTTNVCEDTSHWLTGFRIVQ